VSGDSSERRYVFPTTHWSLIGRAGGEADAVQSAALNELLKKYWPALKAHLLAKRTIDPHEADDLVQGFIENKILEHNLLSVADARRGKFRNLLARALDNYVVNQWERSAAKKREVERAVSYDTEARAHWAAHDATPSQAFDVEWAREVLSQALRRMKVECGATGRDDLWVVFEGRVLAPIFHGTPALSYESIVSRFGYTSPSHASNALVTAKRMFARVLRAVVSEYALDEDDIESELGDLHRILSDRAS